MADLYVENGVINSGSFGVNLYFIESFVAKYKIDAKMTTAEVVQNIIIPETREHHHAYVERVLKYQETSKVKRLLCTNLKRGSRNVVAVPGNSISAYFGRITQYQANSGITEVLCAGLRAGTHILDSYLCCSEPDEVQCYFLSHCCRMPFLLLVEIIRNSHREANWNEKMMAFKRRHVYYWIDVFCKNQHFQSPTMTEFRSNMGDAGQMLIALWPREPVALSRIWCIFELFCAIESEVPIFASFADEDRKLVFRSLKSKKTSKSSGTVAPAVSQTVFDIHVELADATVKTDIPKIMEIINSKMSTENMNRVVAENFTESFRRQFDTTTEHAITFFWFLVVLICVGLYIFGIPVGVYVVYKIARWFVNHYTKVDCGF
jgi:hypothetical protein